MKAVTLCADDFAQSPGIAEGILRLLADGRLSATSVMSESPHWSRYAPALRRVARHADVGLHLNLTHGFGQRARPLPWWTALSQLGLLSAGALRRRTLAQIDAFADAYGELPAFVDGHQHVHALPQVRDALFDAIAVRWAGRPPPWLRAPDLLADPGDSAGKARVLKWLCRGFAAEACARGHAVPAWYAGVYSLDARAPFAALMDRWLAASPNGALLMCHPGHAPGDPRDPIADQRGRELAWLAGDGLADACRRHGVALARFGRR
jgi:predicted glycoside hydrolase/deacetylase ChbG (UPF0249 family)